MNTVMLMLATFGALAACGGASPDVRYYQLAAVDIPPQAKSDRVIAVEAFSAEGAYDDDRIIYRSTPYRLDYYQYHRWSAAPGLMVSGYFEQALAKTGAFRAVVRDQTPEASLVIRGRVVAIEEIDRTKTQWVGRIAVEIAATDPKTGETVWSQAYDETEPLPMQSPEGLARALSIAVARIATRAAPELAKLSTAQARR